MHDLVFSLILTLLRLRMTTPPQGKGKSRREKTKIYTREKKKLWKKAKVDRENTKVDREKTEVDKEKAKLDREKTEVDREKTTIEMEKAKRQGNLRR